MMRDNFQVVIIGAGAAGLATAAHLKRQWGASMKFVVLEGSDSVGSSWHRKRYSRLHLHTPKNTSALPFLPYPKGAPKYPSAAQVVDYMRDYVKHLELPVLLRHHVMALAFDDKTSQYTLTVKVWSGEDSNSGGYTGGPAAEADKTIIVTCKCLVLATGPESVPFVPELPDRDLFPGPVVHSSDYKDGSLYRGKRVLVVGSGNSGGEISVCLAEHGAQPTLLVRRQNMIVCKPDDGLATKILMRFDLKKQVRPQMKLLDKFAGIITWVEAPNMRPYGIPQIFPGWFGNRGLFESVTAELNSPLVDIGQCAAIKKGLVKVMRGELLGYSARGAKIGPAKGETGEMHEHEFDAILLCTGYQWSGSFSRILPQEIQSKVLPANGTRPPSGVETKQPGLFLVGLEDMFSRFAMVDQEGAAVSQAIGQRLGLDESLRAAKGAGSCLPALFARKAHASVTG